MSPFIVRTLTLLVLAVMVVFSFTPIPGTTLIMIYVVLFRPRWFKRLVDIVYEAEGEKRPRQITSAGTAPQQEHPTPGGNDN